MIWNAERRCHIGADELLSMLRVTMLAKAMLAEYVGNVMLVKTC